MTKERRFSEQEVAFILEQAASREQREDAEAGGERLGGGTSASSRGMSLAQLTEVAREAGIDPNAIVAAARDVERGDLVPTQRQTAYGLPVGVGRVIQFSRRVTDAEWERMVVALRETFQSRGVLRQEGTLRSWNSGNLQALLEPTATGHRLRLRTHKGDARVMMQLGAMMLVIAATLGALLAAKTGTAPAPWWSPAMIGLSGLAMIGSTAIKIPRWARTRASQMEAFSLTASEILAESDAVKAVTAGDTGEDS